MEFEACPLRELNYFRGGERPRGFFFSKYDIGLEEAYNPGEYSLGILNVIVNSKFRLLVWSWSWSWI